MDMGMPLRGEVRVRTVTTPSCPTQRGPAYESDGPKNAWTMVERGHNACQYGPCAQFV